MTEITHLHRMAFAERRFDEAKRNRKMEWAYQWALAASCHFNAVRPLLNDDQISNAISKMGKNVK